MKFFISEIFASIQGEGRWTGYPRIFVRLGGCNVGCAWCDTEYNTFSLVEEQEIIQLLNSWHEMHPSLGFTITGGEPLLSTKRLSFLIEHILEKLRRPVFIETSGHGNWLPIFDHKNVWITCAPKGPWIEGVKKLPNWTVVHYANEVKWLWPDTPHKVIELHAHKCRGIQYIQPVNEVDEHNKEHVAMAYKNSLRWGIPLSLQVHKCFDWR